MLSLLLQNDGQSLLTDLGIGTAIGIGLKSLLDFVAEPLLLRCRDRAAQRTQIREQQAEIIRGVYTRLMSMRRKGKSFASPVTKTKVDEEKRNLYDELADAANAYFDYYEVHGLYFPQHIENMLGRIYVKLKDPFDKLIAELSTEGTGPRTETWASAWNAVDKDLSEALDELKTEFRRMLGVTRGRRKSPQ